MLGTPLKKGATRLLLLGSGELEKEVVIKAQRLGLALALGKDTDEARSLAEQAAHAVTIHSV